MKLQNRVVVVTGAARGIGAACAQRAAAEGASVVLSDLNPAGEDVAAAIRAQGGKAQFVAGDVARSEDNLRLLDVAEQQFGLVDGCIAAAGIAPHVPFLDMSDTDFMRVLEINLKSAFVLGQAVARRLVAAGKPGAIVNITSTSARLAGPEQAGYCASKGGLDALTRAMAIALAQKDIRVNALAPGPTDTGLAATVSPAVIAALLSRTPLGRFSTPDEQARVAIFLLSDDAAFMTGETVYVDGGRCALQYTMPPRPA